MATTRNSARRSKMHPPNNLPVTFPERSKSPFPVNGKVISGESSRDKDYVYLDTNGVCLLCYEELPPGENDEKRRVHTQTSINFCRLISRYLQFNVEDVIGAHPLRTLGRWRSLEVEEKKKYDKVAFELCERCVSLAHAFNQVHFQVQFHQMILDRCVRSISDIIQKANKKSINELFVLSEDEDALRKQGKQLSKLGLGGFRNAHRLRSKIYKSSLLKLSRTFPIIKLKRITKLEEWTLKRSTSHHINGRTRNGVLSPVKTLPKKDSMQASVAAAHGCMISFWIVISLSFINLNELVINATKGTLTEGVKANIKSEIELDIDTTPVKKTSYILIQPVKTETHTQLQETPKKKRSYNRKTPKKTDEPEKMPKETPVKQNKRKQKQELMVIITNETNTESIAPLSPSAILMPKQKKSKVEESSTHIIMPKQKKPKVEKSNIPQPKLPGQKKERRPRSKKSDKEKCAPKPTPAQPSATVTSTITSSSHQLIPQTVLTQSIGTVQVPLASTVSGPVPPAWQLLSNTTAQPSTPQPSAVPPPSATSMPSVPPPSATPMLSVPPPSATPAPVANYSQQYSQAQPQYAQPSTAPIPAHTYNNYTSSSIPNTSQYLPQSQPQQPQQHYYSTPAQTVPSVSTYQPTNSYYTPPVSLDPEPNPPALPSQNSSLTAPPPMVPQQLEQRRPSYNDNIYGGGNYSFNQYSPQVYNYSDNRLNEPTTSTSWSTGFDLGDILNSPLPPLDTTSFSFNSITEEISQNANYTNNGNYGSYGAASQISQNPVSTGTSIDTASNNNNNNNPTNIGIYTYDGYGNYVLQQRTTYPACADSSGAPVVQSSENSSYYNSVLPPLSSMITSSSEVATISHTTTDRDNACSINSIREEPSPSLTYEEPPPQFHDLEIEEKVLNQRRAHDDDESGSNPTETVAKSISVFPEVHWKQQSTGTDKRISCSHSSCKEQFISDTQLQLHLRAHGSFKCNFCSLTFGKAHNLALHEKMQHSKSSGSKGKCPRCGITITQSVYKYLIHFLDSHMNISVHDPPCEICNKQFVFGTKTLSRKIHFKKYHEVQGKDPTSIKTCKTCSAPFLKDAQLKDHQSHCSGTSISTDSSVRASSATSTLSSATAEEITYNTALATAGQVVSLK